MGAIVLPDQFAVAKAHEAFQPDGLLTDPKQQAGIEGLGKTLASFLMKLKW
jgi:chromate reductase